MPQGLDVYTKSSGRRVVAQGGWYIHAPASHDMGSWGVYIPTSLGDHAAIKRLGAYNHPLRICGRFFFCPQSSRAVVTHTGGCRWFPTIFSSIFFPIMAWASVPIQTKKQDQRSGRRPHERTALHSQTIADTPPSPSFINAHDLAAFNTPAFKLH